MLSRQLPEVQASDMQQGKHDLNFIANDLAYHALQMHQEGHHTWVTCMRAGRGLPSSFAKAQVVRAMC